MRFSWFYVFLSLFDLISGIVFEMHRRSLDGASECEKRIIRSQPPYAMGSHQTPDWFQVHGFSPLPGSPPAPWRSIIIACIGHRLSVALPNYRRINVYRSFLVGRSWRIYGFG